MNLHEKTKNASPIICAMNDSLYDRPEIVIKKFDKKYLVSFMNRNDKDVEHLIIMNYDKYAIYKKDS